MNSHRFILRAAAILFAFCVQQIFSAPETSNTVTGILTDANFRVALHALEQRTGTEILPEPEVVTTVGRSVNRISTDYILAQYTTPSTQLEMVSTKKSSAGVTQFLQKEIAAQEVITPTNHIELFNGTNFDGFAFCMKNDGDLMQTWSVTNGVIHCNGSAIGYLRTKQAFSNYVVTVEWRFLKVAPKKDNTGVLVNMQLPDKVWPQCVQNQGKSGRQGDLFVMAGAECKEHLALGKDANTPVAFAGESAEKTVGEWNTNVTVCAGDNVQAIINGKSLNKISECTISNGFVGIQSEGADFEIRKMFLEPLKHDVSDGSSSSKTASKEFIKWEHNQASQNQVVAYAIANTNDAPNIILTVSELWKGADDSKSIGITNGMQFPMEWPAGQTLPDGAIMFFSHDTDPSKTFLGGGAMFIQKGYVGDMTFQEFKSNLGLKLLTP